MPPVESENAGKSKGSAGHPESRATLSSSRRLAASWLAFRVADLRRRRIVGSLPTWLGGVGVLLALAGLVALPAPISVAHALIVAAIAALIAGLHLALVSRVRASHELPTGEARFSVLCDTLEKRIETLHDAHWEISESDVRYRDLLDAQSDVILRRDGDGRLTFVNSAFVRTFGIDAAAALGKPFARDVVEAAGVAPLATSDAERNRRYTECIGTAAGPRWIEWDEHLVASGDGSLEVQAVGRDITEERRQAEELAEARDAAEAANRAKSRFLAAMSHEIRTPMNGILGLSALLRETPLSDEQCTYVGAVEQSARALLTLIDEILDFSKIEAGKLVLCDAPFDITAAVQSVVELLSPRAHEKGLELALTVDPALDRVVVGDEARVRQVLLNLLSNAVKFTDHGGVSVAVAGSVAADGRIKVSLSVEDSGIGLSSEDMRRLFLEFEQADAAQRRQQGGTGLGLAISKRLALAMGGDIRVASTPGRGSTFTAEIVLGASRTERDGERVGKVASCDVQCVLLAFDRRIERASLSAILCSAGHRVIEADMAAAHGAIADAAHSGEPVTRVIVDVGCDPRVAGELLVAARAVSGGRYVAGIVTVNVLARAGLSLFRSSGFERYLVRPVRASALLQQVSPAGSLQPSPPSEPSLRVVGEAASDARARPVDIAPIWPQPTVLLVEDNDINALLASRVIERAGCKVVHCREGHCGIVCATAVLDGSGEPVDLVLMDIFMPGIDGVTAAAEIRAAFAGQEGKVPVASSPAACPPIVALTANAFPEDRQRYIAEGFDDYLAKPFDTADLALILARWLGTPVQGAPRSRDSESRAANG